MRPLVLVVLVALLAPLTAGQFPASWDQLAPLPRARTEVTAVAVGGDVWVLGGIGTGALDGLRVDIYSPATDTWRAGPSLPVALHHAPAVVLGPRIVVLGGLATDLFLATSTTWMLDTSSAPAAQAWVPWTPLPEPRGAHAAVTDGSTIYVFGGYTLNGLTPSLLSTAWKLDTVGGVPVGAWTPLPTFPDRRDHLAGAFLDGRVVAVGGRDLALATNTGRVDVYDPATNAWSRAPDMPTPRGGIAAVALAGHVVVFGGEGPGGTFATTEAFDPASNAWTTLAPMPHRRHGLGAAVIGDAAYVAAGGPVPGFTYSTFNERLRAG